MSHRRPAYSDSTEKLTCFPYSIGSGSEGVCLLVQIGSHRILLDCGLTNLSLLQNSANLPADLVLCTHAHCDHAQGLLPLHQAFPKLPIYTSEITAKLLHLNWSQSKPEEISQFCKTLPWRSPVNFGKGLSVELFPAGHLPGAAVILLTYVTPKRSYKLLYTGDFFLSNSRLVDGLAIEELRGTAPDVLIIESSYGTARHSHRRQQENQLMAKINRALANNCSVLMPVPPLGLAQEILVLLRSHHQFTGRDVDIWVDSTIATSCDVYLELLPHLRESVQNFAQHQPLFWDERVRPRMRRLPSQEKPKLGESPCIVLTDYKADFKPHLYSEPRSWVVLLPEQPIIPLTPNPKKLLAAAHSLQLKIETYLLALHSDGLGTTQLIHNLRPQHVVFVHGSPRDRAALTSLEELQSRYHLHSPAAGTLVELPIGETFFQPAAPTEISYEGEINEVESIVNITLPDSVTSDPRWNNFADTGLIEARWQGEELILRGLSQRELLSQSQDAKIPTDLECCGNCRHQRSQRCCNPVSPLYGFKVTPDGYCTVFEPADL